MLKCISNLLCFIVMVATLEFCLYKKGKNDLMLLKRYIEFDIKNKDLKSFSNDKYRVVIENNKYCIEIKRESLIRIKQFKNLKYVGLV